jgi:hypothetical protein
MVSCLETFHAKGVAGSVSYCGGARWRRDQSVQRTVAKVKQYSQSLVIGWMTKNVLSRGLQCFAEAR